MKITRARILGLFLAVTCVLAWGPALIYAGLGGHADDRGARALAIFQAFAPLVGALVVQGPLLKGKVLAPLGVVFSPNPFWIAAWLSPLLVLAVGLVTAQLVFGIDPILDGAELLARKRAAVPPGQLDAFDRFVRDNPAESPLSLVLMALPAGLTVNLFFALSEEVGFRGLLFREMPGGFWPRSLAIGLVQGLLAVPNVLLGLGFTEHRLEGAVLLVAYYVLLSPALVYVRVRGGSVIPVALMRGTTLALMPVAADLAFGADPRLRPPFGVAGLVALVVLLGVFAVHDRFAKAKLMTGGEAVHTGARRPSGG